MGKNSVQAKQYLYKYYSESALWQTMVNGWYSDFKCGSTGTSNAERSGHSTSAVVPENTHTHTHTHTHKNNSTKLKLCEIAEELNISEGSVFTILHEHLWMRKLCSKWVLRLLIVYQKQHVDGLERCLQLFQRNKKEFLCKYVTTDETWINHFTQKSNQWLAERTVVGESHSKRPKM